MSIGVFFDIDAAWQIMIKKDIAKIKYELLSGSIVSFSIFHGYSGKDITHTKSGIRLHSIIAAVGDTIVKGLNMPDPEIQIEKIDTVIDVFMEVAQQFMSSAPSEDMADAKWLSLAGRVVKLQIKIKSPHYLSCIELKYQKERKLWCFCFYKHHTR